MEIDTGKMSSHRVIFSPPLSTQRYCWVQNFLQQEHSIKSLTDVGCGNGRMLNWLKTVSHLEQVNCIDSDHLMLEYEMDNYFRPNLCEMLFGRRNSDKQLDINVFQGDIAVPDERLQSDCFTMVEMIEHVNLEHAERASRTVFGYYQPRFVIVTTPNREFNHLLRQDGESVDKFRHIGHKFEWSREEFTQWAQRICSKYPYQVFFDGVGHLPGSEPYGPCTQIALFKRTSGPIPKTETDLTCLDLFINKLSVEKTRPEFCGDWRLKRICLMTSFKIPGATQYQLKSTQQTCDDYWGDPTVENEDIECTDD